MLLLLVAVISNQNAIFFCSTIGFVLAFSVLVIGPDYTCGVALCRTATAWA